MIFLQPATDRFFNMTSLQNYVSLWSIPQNFWMTPLKFLIWKFRIYAYTNVSRRHEHIKEAKKKCWVVTFFTMQEKTYKSSFLCFCIFCERKENSAKFSNMHQSFMNLLMLTKSYFKDNSTTQWVMVVPLLNLIPFSMQHFHDRRLTPDRNEVNFHFEHKNRINARKKSYYRNSVRSQSVYCRSNSVCRYQHY